MAFCYCTALVLQVICFSLILTHVLNATKIKPLFLTSLVPAAIGNFILANILSDKKWKILSYILIIYGVGSLIYFVVGLLLIIIPKL